jgi:hypothetical protein
MTHDELLEEIFQEALGVAGAYFLSYSNRRDDLRKWSGWGSGAKEDFWSIAQDTLEIPDDQRVTMPDEFLTRDDRVDID